MADLFISRQQAEADLLAAAAFIGERIRSADGHAEAMNTVVPQYLALDNVDLAAELANAVDDPYSRDRLLTQVAVKCAELDDDEYGLQLADAIEDDGIRSQCRERIALIKAAKGDADKAQSIAAELHHPDYVLAGIAVTRSLSGNEDAAADMLGRIDFPSARVSALQNIASAQIEKNESERAVAALDGASEAAREIEHAEERIRALCDIGNAYLEARRSDKAIEALDLARADAEALDNIHRDFFLVNCALGFLHAGSCELADRTLDLVTDKTQMASALVGFARDHWKKDEQEDAFDTLDEAYQILRSQREMETRDSKATNSLMTSVAAQFAAWGKSDLAVDIAHENKDAAEVTNALTQIAQVLVLKDAGHDVHGVINQIAEDADRVYAYIHVADTMLSAGNREGAVGLLTEAMSMADTIPQMVARSTILGAVASRFIEAGENGLARQASLECLGVIIEIRDQSAQATALAEIAAVYSNSQFELGDTERSIVERLIAKADQ